MSQKDIFLKSEGDAWFSRNQQTLADQKLPEDDSLLSEIIEIHNQSGGNTLKVLEVGCGDGTRLAWLKNNLNADCYGIEPSAQAVSAACEKGLNVQQGTADILPFEDKSYDVLIFGFCLYLCDREDLFRVAQEADRVLRSPGWLMILDFFSPTPFAKEYHHLPGIFSYKMDYRTLFNWHPDYECVSHRLRGLSDSGYTDEQEEWVTASTLRKYSKSLTT